MTAEALRAELKRQPFYGFDVKTSDGASYRVVHQEYAMISPLATEVIVYDPDNHYRVIALDQIVAVEPHRPMLMTPDDVRAHRHSSRHRGEILDSRMCGCFHCCETFAPADVTEWTDERDGVGQTAFCPRCGIDSVIGSASGYPITHDFLKQMQERWFS